MSPFAQSVLWFALALALAALEVEIEGEHGWAAKLPTWKRTTGLAGRAFGLFMGGKPLTGYHACMFALVGLMFHLPYTAKPWSLADEVATIALLMLWVIAWDFLWFVLNPAFGLKRFRRENVPWHGKEVWVLWAPISYWLSIGLSIALIGLASMLAPLSSAFETHFILLRNFALFTAAACCFGPLYRDWRSSMDAVHGETPGRSPAEKSLDAQLEDGCRRAGGK
jgi:hypothetical protein